MSSAPNTVAKIAEMLDARCEKLRAEIGEDTKAEIAKLIEVVRDFNGLLTSLKADVEALRAMKTAPKRAKSDESAAAASTEGAPAAAAVPELKRIQNIGSYFVYRFTEKGEAPAAFRDRARAEFASQIAKLKESGLVSPATNVTTTQREAKAISGLLGSNMTSKLYKELEDGFAQYTAAYNAVHKPAARGKKGAAATASVVKTAAALNASAPGVPGHIDSAELSEGEHDDVDDQTH